MTTNDGLILLDTHLMEQQHESLKLVARALEFLAEVWPTIPGASVTLTPVQQDELRQIILALPLMVAM